MASPVRVAPLPAAVSVAAGMRYSVAVLAGGTVRAWAANSSSTMGNGERVSEWTEPRAKCGQVTAPAFLVTCALAFSVEIRHNEGTRQVLIYRGEDGFWVAECPSLAGCVSQGETQDSALANIKEAIEAYVCALEADKLPVPEEHFDARLVTV